MAINVKNISKNEVVRISGVKVANGYIVPKKGVLGEKFISNHKEILSVFYVDGNQYFSINEGYELVTGKKAEPKQKAEKATKKAAKKATKKAAEPEPKQEPKPESEQKAEPKQEPEKAEKKAEKAEKNKTPKETETRKKENESVPTIPTQGETQDAFTQAFTPLFKGVASNIEANIIEKLKPVLEYTPQQVVHVIDVNGKKTEFPKSEVFHKNFDDVCKRIANHEWVYLYGPTGSGKNVMAEQIAKALGLNFHYLAHTLDRFELTGFIDANGNYQATEFYKAYTEGGLFMLDELDASDENALITLNSAANGYFAFPCGTVKAHKDFHLIAAGNTCGRGATDDYTARRVLDASSLGRFKPRFHGYCVEIDMAAACDNKELVRFFEEMRKIKKSTGVQMLLSPRQIKGIVSDEAMGVSLSQSMTDLLCSYLTEDEHSIVKNAIRNNTKLANNKYGKAFLDSNVEY